MKKQIENVCVYGIEESITASKYPMAVDTAGCNYDVTNGVIARGRAPIGSAHDCYLKGITAQFDLTMSIKMSVELERYHFIDFVSSQSTMHRIAKLDIDESCNEYVDERAKELVRQLVRYYQADPSPENYLKLLYNVPTGFCLTARMTTNYLQLKTIYAQRHNHRLPEWRSFCKWMRDELPMFAELTGVE